MRKDLINDARIAVGVFMDMRKARADAGSHMKDKGEIFCELVHLAVEKGIIVRFAPLQVSDGRIKGNRIGIRQSLGSIDGYNYNLAHELAHHFLHYDKGDMLDSDKNAEYEEQADRAAKMLLDALSV